MKKRLLLSLLSILLILVIVIGCQNDDEEAIGEEARTINFYYPDGLPALTAAKLSEEKPDIGENISINYEMQETPDLLASKIIKGEADIAIVPSNLAVQAFNKGIPYKLVGTSTWGSIYLVGTMDIGDLEDLKGNEIYAFGKGLTPDIILRYILSENDIDPDEDLEINYLGSGAEVAPAFLGGKTDLALVAEPLATNIMMKKEEARVVLSLNEEWSNIIGSEKGYPQSSLIIKQDLIDDEGDFVEEFLKAYAESSGWAQDNPEGLGDCAENLGINVKKEAIIGGHERLNIGFTRIKDCRGEYEAYFNAILDFAPAAIGEKLPDEEFYFE
ncbi:MAG: ABC transporter substrate-binding protein [Tissierellia bacterium]|nr:ABC transporter substrate-binding protein [Tissierellia bacterium]